MRKIDKEKEIKDLRDQIKKLKHSIIIAQVMTAVLSVILSTQHFLAKVCYQEAVQMYREILNLVFQATL